MLADLTGLAGSFGPRVESEKKFLKSLVLHIILSWHDHRNVIEGEGVFLSCLNQLAFGRFFSGGGLS